MRPIVVHNLYLNFNNSHGIYGNTAKKATGGQLRPRLQHGDRRPRFCYDAFVPLYRLLLAFKELAFDGYIVQDRLSASQWIAQCVPCPGKALCCVRPACCEAYKHKLMTILLVSISTVCFQFEGFRV